MKNLFKSVKLKTAALMAGLMGLAGVSEMQAQNTQESTQQDDYIVNVFTTSALSDGVNVAARDSYLVSRRDIDSLAQVKNASAPALLEEFRKVLEDALDKNYDPVFAKYSFNELANHAHAATNADCVAETCAPYKITNELRDVSSKTLNTIKQETGVQAAPKPQ